jgi:hypothetical protein
MIVGCVPPRSTARNGGAGSPMTGAGQPPLRPTDSIVKQPRNPSSTLILRSRAAACKGEGAASRRTRPDHLRLLPIAVQRTASLAPGPRPSRRPASLFELCRPPQGEGQRLSSRLVQGPDARHRPVLTPAPGLAGLPVPHLPEERAERQGVSPRPRRPLRMRAARVRHTGGGPTQPALISWAEPKPRTQILACVPHANGLCGLLHVPGASLTLT